MTAEKHPTRIGINPARGQSTLYRPAQVTVAVLTYVPSLDGYFEHRLDVLKLVLASLNAHTSLPHDLFIFDNGSCETVVDYLVSLRRSGQVDDLLLSARNIGKIDALRILFNAAPGEIIAYNDDDIFFYPGWLESHLEILDLFPKVGMVSGAPVRNAARHANQSLERLASEPAKVEGLSISRERRIPDDWEADWAASTGRDPEAHLYATRDQLDLIFRMEPGLRPGETHSAQKKPFIEAIGSANHFQFVSPKKIILQALPSDWTGKLMGSMLELDQAIDDLGYLRLSTAQRCTRHLGNTLSQQIRQEAEQMGGLTAFAGQISAPKATARPKERKRHWLLKIPGSRRVFMAIYKRLFNLLYN